MNTVEITTAHNIVIQSELASILIRILAYIIDIMVLIVYTLLILGISNGTIFYYIFLLPVWGFYHFFMEVLNNGQSIGKKLLGIRVVTLRGQTPKLVDFFTRWIFRMIDITFTIGTMAITLISSSAKNQRMGDVLAQTVVIRLRNSNRVLLESIKDIKKKDEFLYPRIASYNDQDMMLLKQSLLRYRELPSEANKDILIKIADKVADYLDIESPKAGMERFLDQVLLEYIILTR